MKLKIAKTCGECPSFRQIFTDRYICNLECLVPENGEMDISTIEVKADSRPEWCRMDKLNRQLSEIDENQEIAIKGMAAFFGAKDIFEDDDTGELIRVVRCKNCKFWKPCFARIIDGKEWNYCEIVKDYKPADWFCADGERGKRT